MIDDTLKSLLFKRRRDSIERARHERDILDMIEAADTALLEDDEKHTKESARAVERALEPLVRLVATECMARGTKCADCPHANPTRTLVDGRTLCEAGEEATGLLKLLTKRRSWLDACKSAIVSHKEQLAYLREKHIVEVETQLEQARAELIDAETALKEVERDFASMRRKLGIPK